MVRLQALAAGVAVAALCGAVQAADPASSREIGSGNLPGTGANGNMSGAAPVGSTVGGAGGGVGNTGVSGTAGPRLRVNAAAAAAARAPAASAPASAASGVRPTAGGKPGATRPAAASAAR